MEMSMLGISRQNRRKLLWEGKPMQQTLQRGSQKSKQNGGEYHKANLVTGIITKNVHTSKANYPKLYVKGQSKKMFVDFRGSLCPAVFHNSSTASSFLSCRKKSSLSSVHEFVNASTVYLLLKYKHVLAQEQEFQVKFKEL